LPMTLTISGPGGDDILVCHGSPSHTRRSFVLGIDEALAAELDRYSERVIVSGHIHRQAKQSWRGKLLLLCGSAGLPLNGSTAAQYLILTHRNGDWQAEHRSIAYDHQAALRRLRQSNFLTAGGPIAWLFYDELWTADLRLIPCLASLDPNHKPLTPAEWQRAVRRYLESIGRWQHLAPILAAQDIDLLAE